MEVVLCDGESNLAHSTQQVNLGSTNDANAKDAELAQTDQQVISSNPASNSQEVLELRWEHV